MTRYMIAAAAIWSVFAISDAFAQDGGKPFHGFYVGGEIGYGNTDLDFDIDGFGDVSLDDDGIRYGGIVGGRWQFDNNLVLGIEGRFGESDNGTALAIGGDILSASTGREFAASGIVGYAFNRGMIFGYGGYSNLKGTASFQGITDSSTLNGLHFGGGFEFPLFDFFSLRLSGGFSDYENLLSAADAAALGGNADAKQAQVNFAILFRFGPR